MKHIVVSKCGECPYCGQKHGGLFCKKIAETHQNEVGFDDIHKDCPLQEMPDGEDMGYPTYDWQRGNSLA